MRNFLPYSGFLLLGALLFTALPPAAGAAPTGAEIAGEIERLTLNDPTDVYSGGVMIVGGTQVILPKNLLLDLPANRLSLQQLFDQAPAACKANGESGLAKADRCNAMGSGGFATLSGVHSTAGNVVAGDVLIEKGKEAAFGVVSYISYSDGYFRLNGVPGDAATGVMVRLNDPTGRHSVQQGAGCSGGPNCSPDPRFTLDPDNYVNTFSSGYPFCIPSTVSRSFATVAGLAVSPAQSSASGTGDALCPATNRTPGAIEEPPVNDSRLFAPILVGDSVKAEGNYESVNGVRFLSSHTTRINKALATKNLPGQPDYLFLEEVFVEAPGFQNQRARALIIGFTTLAPTDVDFWSLHRDPATNAMHEFPLASVQGCDAAAGAGTCSSQGLVGAGGNIFRIRYDVDFLLAASNNPKYPGGAIDKLNPCLHLRGSTRFAASNPGICASGVTLANNFGIMSPIPHEIQARTGHSLDHPGLVTLDLKGNPATNGQYLFPFGMNLGGIETADFLEVDINLLNTPRSFEGIPWNLDRRLSPGGCLKAGGCEATPQPLDPFPYTGLDPRLQAEFLVAGVPGGTPKGSYSDANFSNSTLSNASNRVFSYVSGTPFAGGRFNFDGNNTLLPCAAGLCPPDPGLIAIAATPFLSIYPPIADEDAASTGPGAPVTIDVLANDIAVLGSIDPASVKIAAAPGSGSALVNPSGTITYTPAFSSSGTVSFSYTVANNFGAVSLPGTVNVAILTPPAAVNDAASAAAGSSVSLNLTANDIGGSGVLNIASVAIVSAPTCGTLLNQLDGMVLYTAPAAIPAGGTCSFSYRVSDASTPPLSSNTASATVTITAANLAPVANNDAATAASGATVTIPVLANDSTGGTLNPASILLDLPTGGFASANANGTVSYTAPATPGSYYFAYTVQDNLVPPQSSNPALVAVTVTASDIPPVAGNDTAGTVVNAPVAINVLANDSSATSTLDPASIAVTVPAGNGSAQANPNGTITYTGPALPGNYAFSYTVKDRFVPPATSNVATVLVTVAAANLAPVANNDAASTTPGSTIAINVIGNDTSSTGTLNPASLVLTAATGGFATANANGTVSYTAPAAAGSYSFSYTVKDNFSTPATSNAATVTVSVIAVNLPPVANNDTASALTGATIGINVIANDSSVTSTLNPASLVLTAATGGTATANANGTVSYTAPASAGSYSFSYTVQDNSLSPATSNSATVTIAVTAPVVAPSAVNDTANTAFNTPVTIGVLANDTAGSNAINTSTVTVLSPPANGTAVANLAGTVTYTPALNFSGSNSFSYTVKDSTGISSNPASVTVTVAGAPGETITVSRAQFTLNGASWRVDGTVTPAPAAGTTLTIFNNTTVGTAPLITALPVANNGSFTWSSANNAPQPNALRKISLQSNQNAATKLEGVTVTVR